MEEKRTPIFKYAVLVFGIAVLMLGSGYAGMRIAMQELMNNGPAEAAPGERVIMVMTEAQPSQTAPAHVPGPFGGTFTLADLFENANPAVVAISTQITGRNVFGQTVTRPTAGSGFFVSPNGYIVTNDHVIENATHINVLKYDGTIHTATLIGRDPDSDIAVIKIDANNHTYLTFGDSGTLRVGDTVAAIGNPLGELANSMSAGIISALNRDVTIDGTTRTKIQTDAAVNRGNSGGPLLNLRGEVIGVINAKSVGDNVEGLGFAITANQARAVTENLITYGFVRGRAILGISVNELTDTAGRRMVRIAAVGSDSAAARAGIRVGDIITHIDGTAISTFAQLRTRLDNASPGDAMELRLNRNGQEVTVTAVLDENRPAGV
ncbi:MAG: trypsin-like peptidase domain-containing protein [Defluviitaleaceae bacterium]|nr:trypsin-like peptidase domain-containing protein [Defluviitaleaceae bacterium]MCL2239487.1 trypsin-like peptidase domain-containing protein [Defluviitaleaceae bacterium]